MSEHSLDDPHVTAASQEKTISPDGSSIRLQTSEEEEESVEIGTKLKGMKLVILVVSLMCGIFMVALDGQIIGMSDPCLS